MNKFAMKFGLLFSTMLTCVTISSTAYADVELKGKDTVTAVSGYSGGFVIIETGENYQALQKITWWEDNDDPEAFEIETMHVNNFKLKTAKEVIQYGGSKDTKSVSVAGQAQAIYKIQVCTNDKAKTSKNKLKGLRIWAESINYEQNPVTLTRHSAAIERKHTNCKKWHTPVSCKAGQVARGLRVHHNNDFFTGVALICKKLSTKEGSGIPTKKSPGLAPSK